MALNQQKFLTLMLTVVTLLVTSLPSHAWWFGKKTDVYKLDEKYEYVNMEFWKSFNDDCLFDYISRALHNNHDARKASWKVEEYRQTVKKTFGNELPFAIVSPSYAGTHIPDIGTFSLQKNSFILPFIAGYEADFLLKNRDKTKSSKKDYEATQYEEKSAYISLAGDVASAYINLMRQDKMIELQNTRIKNLSEINTRDSHRLQRGIISDDLMNQSTQNLQNAKNDLNDMLKMRETTLTQLAVLIGESPDNINSLQRCKLDNFGNHINPPDYIESDVIFARPDVMQAEKNLEKAKIDVRVARKELLPRFNIFGIWAFSTATPGTFFSWDSSIAALLASASQDLFMGGRRIANLNIMKSRYEQSLEAYKQTDLNAFKEVNDSLYNQKNDDAIYKRALSNYNLENDNYRQSQHRYKRGTISYPELLNTNNILLDSAQTLAEKKTTKLIDYITLYRAAGGQL